MNNVNLENQLILVDIADVMQDYVSIQPDIDETKVKAACIIAQKIDIQRLIGNDNLQRCINPSTPEDDELKDLIIPALCYFTYARLLKMFHGSFSDSGYTEEGEAENKNIAKSSANEHAAVAEVFMKDAIEFLQLEDSQNEDVQPEKLNPRIRVFGGIENRASN